MVSRTCLVVLLGLGVAAIGPRVAATSYVYVPPGSYTKLDPSGKYLVVMLCAQGYSEIEGEDLSKPRARSG